MGFYCIDALNSSNLKSSSAITSRRISIRMSVSRGGWASFVHHLLTVDGAIFSCSDSHLLVRCFSTRTTLIRFIFFFMMYFGAAKVQKKKKKCRNADAIIRVYGSFFVYLLPNYLSFKNERL